MKPRLLPIRIALHDVPPEGADYVFDRASGELNAALKDLIGSNPYSVRLHIKPMGNSFVVNGRIQTTLNLQCSLCAIDFKFPVDTPVNEVLVVDSGLGRGDQFTRANHAHEWEDSGPECILLKSEVFAIDEYVHEMIALAEPMRPLGRPDCDVACENRVLEVERAWLSIGPENAPDLSNKPFQALERMKLKS